MIYDNFSKTAYIENAKRVLTFFENKICYSDSATGEAICFDVHTGEKAKWAYKDSPLTKIYTSFYCGGKLYFTRYFSADELTGSNLFDESQARAALKAADAGEYGFYIPVVFRCNTDGSDIEPVYYVHGYNIWNITVDGEVMYLYGYTATGGDRFVAYDMSSGVELRISVPISEYHYPGEYDYDENWLSGFRR